jgi:hypothetical protein
LGGPEAFGQELAANVLADLSPSPELAYASPAYSNPPSPINYERVAEGLEGIPVEEPIPLQPASPPVHSSTPRGSTPRPPLPVLRDRSEEPRPLSPLPPAEEAHLEEQENHRVPLYANPCPRTHDGHAHPYIAVATPRRDEWRPQGEISLLSIQNLPTCYQLSAQPFSFPTVTPFRFKGPNTLAIAPVDNVVTATFHVPRLSVCCKALRVLPSTDSPHGYIKYSFTASILQTLGRLPYYIREAFRGSLVILEVIDFLDGRQVTIYGYLSFRLEDVFIEDQGLHCEDAIRACPRLLAFTFTPRIPTNPLDFVQFYPSDLPLVAT